MSPWLYVVVVRLTESVIACPTLVQKPSTSVVVRDAIVFLVLVVSGTGRGQENLGLPESVFAFEFHTTEVRRTGHGAVLLPRQSCVNTTGRAFMAPQLWLHRSTIGRIFSLRCDSQTVSAADKASLFR